MINSVATTNPQRIDLTAGASVAGKAATPTVNSPSEPKAEPAADGAQLSAAVSKLNDYVQTVQRNLSFSVDKDTGKTVIKVLDSQTNEVIRQLPPDETLRLAAWLDKEGSNLFLQERA